MLKLETSIERLPLTALRHLDVNARYMTSAQQQRLTDNIKADGVLTSLPLVWLIQSEDGTATETPPVYEIVSGNHRVTSARDAGLESIDVIVIANWISPARRVQIQLAHNAVGGQDDLSILEQLYEGLDLAGKEYSGLTDDAFKGLRDLKLDGFNVAGPDYQEIYLTFLPTDAVQFEAAIKRASKGKGRIDHFIRVEDFSTTFDAVVRVKEGQNILNSALAFSFLAELAMERLDQIEAEAAKAQAQQDVDDAASLVEDDDKPADPPKPKGKKKSAASTLPTVAHEESV